MTKHELEAEVERLRSEVALLRSQQAAHVCPVAAPWYFPTNVCAGAAGMPITTVLNTGAAQPFNFEGYYQPSVAAGCAAPMPMLQTFILNA